MAQNVTRSLILISGTPVEALILARKRSRPPALAEVWSVYCAVVANDSRMRRAMVVRMPDMRVAAGPGGTRSLESTMPPVPEPSPPISMPSAMRLFVREETRGDS